MQKFNNSAGYRVEFEVFKSVYERHKRILCSNLCLLQENSLVQDLTWKSFFLVYTHERSVLYCTAGQTFAKNCSQLL